MKLEEKQAEFRQQLKIQRPRQRKPVTRDKVDYNTLYAMYVTQCLQVNEISRRLDKSRQRIFQLLKEYGIHNKTRKQVTLICAYCHEPFEVVKSRVDRGGGKYCSEDHYYEHKRAVSDYKPNRQGQKLARKAIAEYLNIPACYEPSKQLVIHHEDGNCLNNDLNNLFVFPSHSAHLKYHHAKRKGNATLPYKEISELPNKLSEWFD